MAGPSRSTPAAGSSRHEEYKVQPPRPPNAWILYRSHQFAQIRQSNERVSQAEVSKRISHMWKQEAEGVKHHFEQMAEAEKLKHQQLYPDYRFCPQKREDKLRSKEEIKQSRRAKKSKARDATPPNANATVTPPMLPPPAMPRPYFLPGYAPNMVLPQSYLFPYSPEALYGPGGPSPPISAAPSPAPYDGSQSPYSDGNVASSSSSPSVRPSTSSDSRASSSSSQLPANQFYIPSLPGSHQPSPNAYATQSLPALVFQPSPPGEPPLTSPQSQPPSPENTVVPAATVWNNIHTQLPNLESLNSKAVNFDIPINQTQSFTEFQQGLESMLATTDENSVFSSSSDTSDLVVQPLGQLEVGMGAQAPTADYNGQLFTDFDLAGFQQQIASLTEAGSNPPQAAFSSVQEDIESLFLPSNNPEVQAYTAAQQRQPSVFTQDMMNFLDFEAAEGSTEDTSPAVSALPVPTTVTPQQVRLQNTQHGAGMPIFTQMTNTPTVASGSSYVPPAGAIYSSTRRVAGSWKPSFAIPPQMEDPVQSWTLSTN